jgi:hypothetical protein
MYKRRKDGERSLSAVVSSETSVDRLLDDLSLSAVDYSTLRSTVEEAHR